MGKIVGPGKSGTYYPRSMELRGGQPWADIPGPPGGQFVGWVLVQVWQTPKGLESHINCSIPQGRHAEVADHVAKEIPALRILDV